MESGKGQAGEFVYVYDYVYGERPAPELRLRGA